MKNNRIIYVDMLRILAVFLVILIHVSGSFWSTTDVRTLDWQMFNIYDSLARSAVPIFVMISGMLLLQPKKHITIKSILTKNVSRLLIAYLFWSFIYALYVFIRSNKVWSPEILDWFITKIITGHFHLWYIPMLIGIYLITPALRTITEKNDKNLLQYLLCIFFLFGIVKNTLSLFDIPEYLRLAITKIPVEVFVEYTGYYLLGYYLYTFPIAKNKRIWIYGLGIISVVTTIAVSIYFALDTNQPSSKLYGNHSITTFFEAIAIVTFFKYTFNKWDTYEQALSIIKKLSALTFGIYLVHDIFISELKLIGFTTTSFNPVLSVPIISIIVFILSSCTIFIIKKIPYINKFII